MAFKKAFQHLKSKYDFVKQNKIAKKTAVENRKKSLIELEHLLYAFTEDGILTSEEKDKLNIFLKENNLNLNDLDYLLPNIYGTAALKATSDKLVTTEEYSAFLDMQNFLDIKDSEIAHTKFDLLKLMLINEYNNGRIPNIGDIDLIFQKNEKGLWQEEAGIIEERVVKQEYVGGSRGVSIRIVKGLSYRVGASRGQFISETANVIVSQGRLTITNKRIVFVGDKKSFSKPIRNLINYDLFEDGIRFHFSTGKPILIKTNRDVSDILGASIMCVINE